MPPPVTSSLRLFGPLLFGFLLGSVLAALFGGYAPLLLRSLLVEEVSDDACVNEVESLNANGGHIASWQQQQQKSASNNLPQSLIPSTVTEQPSSSLGLGTSSNGANSNQQTTTSPSASPAKRAGRVNRPRFYATELGIRDKLFVAVLTSRASVQTMAIAINRTLSHHVSKAVFFVEGAHAESLPGPINLMGLANIPPHLMAVYIFEYISKHALANYDWFLLMPDWTYVKGFKLYELVTHMSVGHNIAMGRPYENPDENMKGVCRFDAGILLSSGVVQRIVENFQRCVLGASVNSTAALNLELCIRRVGNAECREEWNGKVFKTWRLLNETNGAIALSAEQLQQVVDSGALSVFPLSSTTQLYQLQRHFCRKEMEQIQGLAQLAKDSIRAVAGMVPEEERSWPFGSPRHWRPKNRYEVSQWEFFGGGETEQLLIDSAFERNTEEAIVAIEDNSRRRRKGKDIQLVSAQALQYLARTSPDLSCSKVTSGYRRFDPTRGMDYIVDVECSGHGNDTPQSGSVRTLRRIRVLRPLNRVEIVPVPHVTEATEVSLILVVRLNELGLADAFLGRKMLSCVRSQENLNFILVILYSFATATQLANSRQLLSKLRNSRLELIKQQQHSNVDAIKCKLDMVSLQMEHKLPVPIVSAVIQQLGADHLFLMGHPLMNLEAEFLNRVRMNTIRDFQVFFPVPFAQFNPIIAFNGAPTPLSLDVHKEVGTFNVHSFEVCSFYGTDFEVSRQRATARLGSLLTADLVNFFLSTRSLLDDAADNHNNLHIMRAIEPALNFRYDHRGACDQDLPETAYAQCLVSQKDGLASKAALAKLVFQQLGGSPAG